MKKPSGQIRAHSRHQRAFASGQLVVMDFHGKSSDAETRECGELLRIDPTHFGKLVPATKTWPQ
jgi:hypothetical protein